MEPVGQRQPIMLRLAVLLAAVSAATPPAVSSAAAPIHGSDGTQPGGSRRLGAITGDEFLPETLPHPCEVVPGRFEAMLADRKYEHGTAPGMCDSEDESEYLHEKAANAGQEPDPTPRWAKHLQMKLRIAQKGGLGSIGAAGGRTALDAAGISLADGSAAEHQRGIWERVCGKMVDMMDPGCGHNTPPFEETRAAMYAMMQKKAPATRAQRALAIIERNRQKRMEQLLVLKAKAVIRGEMHPDDVADPQERALIIAALKVHLRDLKEQARAAPVSFGAVVDATARTYINQVALAGVGVWVVVHLYSAAREDCRFVDAVFTSLAPRRPAVKFVRVEYREALPEMDTVVQLFTTLLCQTDRQTDRQTHTHTHTHAGDGAADDSLLPTLVHQAPDDGADGSGGLVRGGARPHRRRVARYVAGGCGGLGGGAGVAARGGT